tara:strand:+ start:30391 stop:31434 length:1044 start_codon:yes stop_codon:yes gene_type:complete
MQLIRSLDYKLNRIADGSTDFKDFIIADAKDADMAFGITAPGPSRSSDSTHGYDLRYKTLPDYQTQIREVIQQQIVDIVLLSASNLEQLAMEEKLFENSPITPAARANDTTDIWAVRGGKYASQPSRHFRSATLDHIKYGKVAKDHSAPPTGADLGLYSVTFTNHLDRDYAALEAFHDFRSEAESKNFRYFLEVFNPNVDPGFPPDQVGAFLNDSIIRCLAGVTKAGRPLFLKIPYNGPGPLEELVSYDPNLVVGILGGSAGTTRDAFQLIYDASQYGARVALFGRKINLSEHPLTFIELLRRVTDREITPTDAVSYYHNELQKAGIQPRRSLEDDQQLTDTTVSYS